MSVTLSSGGKTYSGKSLKEAIAKRDADQNKEDKSSERKKISEGVSGDLKIEVYAPARDEQGRTATDVIIEKNKKKKSGSSNPVQYAEGTPVVLTSPGGQEYSGQVVGEKVIAVRTVSKQEQQQREVEKAIKANRERLMVTPSTQPGSITVLPLSQINAGNASEQIRARSALPTVGILADAGNVAYKVSKKQPERNIADLPMLVTGRDIRESTTLGIREPGFFKNTEYDLRQQAGKAEIEYFRSGDKVPLLSTSYLKSAGYNLLATPVSLANKPIRSGLIIAGTILTRNLLSAGGIVSTTQATGGLIAYGTAISAQQEYKQGGSGSRTLGELGFVLTTVAAGAGVKKLKSELFDRTAIKYRIVSKGSEGKDFTGVTKEGSILNNKKYVEAFTTKGDTTLRTINYKGQTVKITETETYQLIKTFKNGKLVDDTFRYIDSGQSIRGSVIPQVSGRKTLFLDQGEIARTSKLSLLETTSGSLSRQQTKNGQTVKIDLNVADTFRRNIIATDEVIKVSGKGLRTVEFIKPEFSFSKKASYPKDQVIIQEVGVGKNAGLQRIDIVAPRVVEKSAYYRTAVGTVEITKEPLLSRISLDAAPLGKKGSASLSGVLDVIPKISISPKTSPGFSLNVPSLFSSATGSGLKAVPVFTFASGQRSSSVPVTSQAYKSELKIEPIIDVRAKPKVSTSPQIRIDQSFRPASILGQGQGLRQGQTQSSLKLQLDLQTPIAPIPGFGSGSGFKEPVQPITPGPGITLPKFNLVPFGGKRRSPSIGISQSKAYRPSLEAIVFNIEGDIKQNITPFDIRPKPRRKKRK